jgi:hypothetical protein
MSSKQMSNEEKRKFAGILITQYGCHRCRHELLPLFTLLISLDNSEHKVLSVCSKIEKLPEYGRVANNFEQQTLQNLSRLQPKQFHFSSSKQAFGQLLGLHCLDSINGICDLYLASLRKY